MRVTQAEINRRNVKIAMRLRWEVKPAAPEHIPAIAADMWENDKNIAATVHMLSPERALEKSFASSEQAWTCLIGATPAFMWGVCRIGGLLSDRGSPWLLGTNSFFNRHYKRMHKEFLRQSPIYISKMHELFPRLENYIHVKSILAMRLLKHCGFIKSDVPAFINGEAFYLFWRNAQCV